METSTELHMRLESLYGAMSGGDVMAVEDHYSLMTGGVFIGTDESEFWVDSEQHNLDVRPFFDGSQATRVVMGLTPQCLTEGTVGWTVDEPTFHIGTDSVRVRLTLVWHLEGDDWKIVHSHASVGAP